MKKLIITVLCAAALCSCTGKDQPEASPSPSPAVSSADMEIINYAVSDIGSWLRENAGERSEISFDEDTLTFSVKYISDINSSDISVIKKAGSETLDIGKLRRDTDWDTMSENFKRLADDMNYLLASYNIIDPTLILTVYDSNATEKCFEFRAISVNNVCSSECVYDLLENLGTSLG